LWITQQGVLGCDILRGGATLTSEQIIAALIATIGSLTTAFLSLGKMLLSEKDKQIAYRDVQIAARDKEVDRWEGIASTNGTIASDSLRTVKEVQEAAERIERELYDQRVERAQGAGKEVRRPRGTA
jgi:DNA-binding PucR family transcriptional regulator